MNHIPIEPQITSYLYQKATAAGVPISGTFELTPVCNMDCKMCYVRMSKGQQEAVRPLRTADEWLDLAKRAKDAGMLYLLLTGGEPFLHPQFREILTGLHQMGFVLSINSNGTMIDEKAVEWLKTVPPTRINISLYGASNETYARLCGNPQGFTQVDRAITLLCEAGISVKLNCSLTPYNAEDLAAMTAYAEQRGLVLQVATYMFPSIRKDASMVGKNDRFSPEEAARYAAYSELLALGKTAFLAAGEHLPMPTDIEESCAEIGDGVRCRAGRCSFWITWEGRMTPCGMFPCDGALNVFETDFNTVWQTIRQQTAAIRLPAQCADCSMKKNCRACAAMVMAESGRFDQVPSYRCQMTKAYPVQYHKLAKQVKEETE